MASLSFARLAYMLWCSATPCMLVAWCNDESEEETLGNATRGDGLLSREDMVPRKNGSRVEKEER